ncbi:hypothetical protein HY970_02875 [Candidatus Kaiserbacteria bacterium]|nr:hypothetical protein [Candidatus Kaiserbacteria bacterium]
MRMAALAALALICGAGAALAQEGGTTVVPKNPPTVVTYTMTTVIDGREYKVEGVTVGNYSNSIAGVLAGLREAMRSAQLAAQVNAQIEAAKHGATVKTVADPTAAIELGVTPAIRACVDQFGKPSGSCEPDH